MPDYTVDYPSTLWERRKLEAMSRIQRVALDLFDEYGYREVTVDRVAAAAGVSASSVYRYFGTKEMLVLYDEADPQVLDVVRRAGGGELVTPLELLALARPLAPLLIEALLTEDAQRRIASRQRYVQTISEVCDGQNRRMRELEDQFRVVFAERCGRDANDLQLRLAAATVVWGCVAALDHWAGTGFAGSLKEVYTRAIDSIADVIETLFR